MGVDFMVSENRRPVMPMKDVKAVETPELERLSEVSERSNAIGQFLDWLREEKGYHVMRWSVKRDWADYDEGDPEGDEESELGGVRVLESTEKLLAEFFDIDLEKVERERRALLDAIRG
jgi:hypothetical protein